MMKFRIFPVLLLCLLFNAAFAQTKIKGKIVDAVSNSPLYGATVSFSGSSATTTDKNGEFTVDCSKASTLTVSFVGYKNYQHVIKNCNEAITIALTRSEDYLNQVEISATSNQNKSILYQPASITKLTPVELKRSTGLFLMDAINGNVPGVQMQSRAVSSGQQFNIRGYGNGSRGPRGVSSNFDGQGYKVYLNGIPVTDAEGITTLDDIDFGSIGNVEITKGPAGTLYGLAIAGAVNLKTQKAEPGKTSIGQDVMIGNYGLQRYTTRFSMGGAHSSLLVNYGHQKSDGYTIHNASHKDFVNIAGDFQPNAKQSFSAYFGYSNSYDQRSGEDSISQYERGDYSGNIEYIKRNAHSAVYTVRAGVGHTYIFNSHISNTTSVFATSFTSNASSAGGWTDKNAMNLGARSTFDTKFAFDKGISLSGITGVETQRQNATTIGYTMVKNPKDTATTWKYGNPYYWIIGAVTSDVYTTTATTSAFTEWTLALPKDLSITAGLGISNMKIGLDDRFYNAAQPNKVRQFDTTYKSMVSPHFAINKVFSKKFSAYFSYSKGYKAPVSSYFYIPAVGTTFNGAVNSNLKPEIGNQFEIGTKGALLNGKLVYEIALFDAQFSNKMTTVAVPIPGGGATSYSYVTNGGKQDDKGIEALVKYTVYESPTGFIRSVTPFGNFTLSNFEYKDYKFQILSGTTVTTVDYSGHDVAGVPKFIGNLGVDATTKIGIYANLTYYYKGNMPTTSLGTDNGLVSGKLYHASSYSLLNAKLGYQGSLSRHFDIDAYFGVNNMANTKYPIAVFVNQYPDAYLVGPVKANYFGGVNLKYNF